ncbi:MAG: hypothetical protein GYB64_08935 [Chloroflexi bacterium]|nr:hypothetical protein [Chloroflexota bacterium]
MDPDKMPTPPVGVIGIISRGFELVADKPILLLFPLLLDLLLLIGPQVDFSELLVLVEAEGHDRIVQISEQAGLPEPVIARQALMAELSALNGGVEPRYMPALGVPAVVAPGIQSSIISGIQPDTPFARDQAPPLLDASVWFQFGVPSLLTGRSAHTSPTIILRIGGPLNAALLLTGLRLCGFALAMVFFMLIAQAVQSSTLSLRKLLADAPRRLLQGLMFAGVLAVITVVTMFIFWLIALVLSLMNLGGGQLVIGVGTAVKAWIVLFMQFGLHGMLLNDRHLFPAIWDSMRVVQWHLPATLLFLMLIFAIDLVFTQIWLLFDSGFLLLPGLVGHSVISAGLVAAGFIYFRDRHRHWYEFHTLLVAELKRRQRERN